MAYIDPNTVVSPKANWTLIKVLRNGEVDGVGDGDASLAIGKWDDQDGQPARSVFALRWNGAEGEGNTVGHPQSRGLPTWFIVPEWLNDAIRGSGMISDADTPFVTALLG